MAALTQVFAAHASVADEDARIAAICDKDAVIAVSGAGKRELIEKPIHEELESVIQSRKRICANEAKGEKLIPITASESEEAYCAELIIPIISAGDPVGAVIMLSKDKEKVFAESDIKVCETAAGFMGKQLEN